MTGGTGSESKGQEGATVVIDTPHGLKPDGFSGSPTDGMTAFISAAYGLKGLPGPTGRCMHGRVAW